MPTTCHRPDSSASRDSFAFSEWRRLGKSPQSWGKLPRTIGKSDKQLCRSSRLRPGSPTFARRIAEFRRRVEVDFEAVEGFTRLDIALYRRHHGLTGIPGVSRQIGGIEIRLACQAGAAEGHFSHVGLTPSKRLTCPKSHSVKGGQHERMCLMRSA